MDDRRLYTDTPVTPTATTTESTLAELWREVLAVSPIGRADNFLELGGTSMLAARVAAKVEVRFGVRFEAHSLLESDTLADVAGQLDELLAPGAAPRHDDSPARAIPPAHASAGSQPLGRPPAGR